MNDRWRNVAIILAVILALLGGITAAVVITGGPAPAVLPSPTTAAGGSTAPSSAGTASRRRPRSLPPSSAPLPSPTAVPSPTPQPNLTTIEFTAMRLDPQSHAATGAAPRTFAFTTEGPGTVTAVFKQTIAGGQDDRLPERRRRKQHLPDRHGRDPDQHDEQGQDQLDGHRDRLRLERADAQHQPDLQQLQAVGQAHQRALRRDVVPVRRSDVPADRRQGRLGRDQGRLGRPPVRLRPDRRARLHAGPQPGHDRQFDDGECVLPGPCRDRLQGHPGQPRRGLRVHRPDHDGHLALTGRRRRA